MQLLISHSLGWSSNWDTGFRSGSQWVCGQVNESWRD